MLLEDYRNLQGSFNKLVSIEMFEAVGLDYYDAVSYTHLTLPTIYSV